VGILIGVQGLQAAGFSKAEWDNPGKAGSSVWLKNGKPTAVRIDFLYVRDNGIHRYGEISMEAGRKKFFFTVGQAKHNEWSRLIPAAPGKIRIRARDSVLVSGFQYGNHLRAKKKPAKILADQYVLELKAVDNTGDSSVVKISQMADSYYIGDNGAWADSGPEKD